MTTKVTIRFYEELNDFLRPDLQKKLISCTYYGKRTVKDLIESYGVPHTEVDLILINGESVGFDHHLKNGDQISVYPMFELLNIGGLSKLRNSPLRETRFILDVHLGKLAKYLRMLGFDVLYDPTMDDPELAKVSHDDKRILLSRDRGLLKRNIIERGMLIRNNKAFEQCLEVLTRLDLWTSIRPFTRCMTCNHELEPISIHSPDFIKMESIVPLDVKEWCEHYSYCSNCHKAYWKGSHWENMTLFIQRIIDYNKGQRV